jgi:multiple sugar transport system permease protein
MAEGTIKEHTEAGEILRRYGLAVLFVAPYLIFFVCFTVIPIGMGVVISFMDYNPYNVGAATFSGFKNYGYLFNPDSMVAKLFWPAFGKTMAFDLCAVPCILIIPLLLAILINTQPPGYKIFRAIIYLPAVTSITVTGIIFSSLFAGDESGLINALFHTDIQWLNEGVLRWAVMLFVSIWWQTGTNFVILSAGLRDVPKPLYEACEMDGGNKWTQFFKVTLPNIKGQINLCLFTTIIGYMGLYGQPTVLYGSDNQPNALAPDTPMIMIQQWLNDPTFAKRTGTLSAVAVVFGLLTMLVTLIEKVATKERKRGDKHERQFRSYTSF